MHHVGCLTLDINKSIENYAKMGFGNVSEIYSISEQKVRVCFVETGDKVYVELIEFSEDNPTLMAIYKNKNRYYHVGYLVDDFKQAVEELVSQGYYLVNEFSSEAFQGKSCAFLYSPELQLIELIES